MMTNGEKSGRAVAYVRVSHERDEMISPELQLRAIEDYGRQRGYEFVAVMQDIDLSGRVWEGRRAGEAVAMVERGEADVIVVWRWSRLSRNRADWAAAVSRVERAGGRVESALEGFDTATSVGRLARGMLAELAAFESDRIGDIWREVHTRRVASGLPPKGHHYFGYVKSRDGYLIDKKTGPILAEMYRRYIAGESGDALARWLQRRRVPHPKASLPSRRWKAQTVLRMLDNGFGAGVLQALGERHVGTQTPVITAEEWAAYRQRREQTRRPRHADGDTFLLRGMLSCPCPRLMAVLDTKPQRSRSRLRHYVCSTRPHRHIVSEPRAEGLIIGWLRMLVEDPKVSSRARIDAADHFANLAAAALRTAVAAHDFPPPAPRPEDTRAQLEEYQAAADASRWRDPVHVARDLLSNWTRLTLEVRRAMLTEIAPSFTVRTGERAKLTAHTAWGTDITFVSTTRWEWPRPPDPDGTWWMTTAEIRTRYGFPYERVHGWYRKGLLPNSRNEQELRGRLYSSRDLERVAAAPRTSRGVDVKAVLRMIEADRAAAAQSPPTE